MGYARQSRLLGRAGVPVACVSGRRMAGPARFGSLGARLGEVAAAIGPGCGWYAGHAGASSRTLGPGCVWRPLASVRGRSLARWSHVYDYDCGGRGHREGLFTALEASPSPWPTEQSQGQQRQQLRRPEPNRPKRLQLQLPIPRVTAQGNAVGKVAGAKWEESVASYDAVAGCIDGTDDGDL